MELDGVRDGVAKEGEVELALWFHDAVYNTRSSTNERDSADWAILFMGEAGATGGQIKRVAAHIMATRHMTEPDSDGSKWVVDIDLTILGSPREAYKRFEEDVRREYAWVPNIVFRRKRIAVMRSFLRRSRIYFTEAFSLKYEDQARTNLEWAIHQLET
jgi:predicted metal-dependent HD superfamily phosphohydrolase